MREMHHEHRQTEADDRTCYQQWLGLLFTKRAGIVLRAVREGIVLRQCELDQLRLQVDQPGAGSGSQAAISTWHLAVPARSCMSAPGRATDVG